MGLMGRYWAAGRGGGESATLQGGGSEGIRTEKSSDRLGVAPGPSESEVQSPGGTAAPPVSLGRHDLALVSMQSGLGQGRSVLRATKRFGKDRLTAETAQVGIETCLADEFDPLGGECGWERCEVAAWSKLDHTTSPREH